MKRKKWLGRIKFLAVVICLILCAGFICAEAVDVEVSAATDGLIYSVHDFGDWVEEVAPTCQHEGVEISKCRNCNVTRRRITTVFDHCYVGEVVTEPTIYRDGVKRYTCIWCNASYDEAIPALSISFTKSFVSPADDPEGVGYILYTCDQDPTYTYTSPLTYTVTVYPATCLEEGYTLYSCNEGDYSYKADYTEKTVHNYVEISRYTENCEDTGIAFYKCTICNANLTLTKAALGHTYKTDTSKSYAATCTKAGRNYAVCTACGKIMDETIPALGHSYVADEDLSVPATCEEGGVTYWICSRCNEVVQEETAPLGHTLVHVEAVEPSDGNDGNIEYWYCEVCGKYFADEEGTIEITEEDIVSPAHVHTLTHVEAVAATETSEGNIEYWYCSECWKYFSDGKGKTEITLAETVIPVLSHTHTLAHVAAVAATETSEGNIEYWYCSGCGKFFSDSAAATQINKSDTVIAKLPHTHTLTHVAAVAATETSEGNIEYWYCSGCGKYFSDGAATAQINKSDTVIAKLSHTHSLTHVDAVEATETSEGNIEYWYCSGCAKYFSDSSATTEISLADTVVAKKEHTHSLTHVEAVEATETSEGNIEYWYCSGCGKYYADSAAVAEISASGVVIAKKEHTHTLTHVEAAEATAEAAGNIEYWYCSGCYKYFSDSAATTEISLSDTVIPATGDSE